MDVLAWGVCNDSSILWGILKTTTQDAVEVWTLWYVNYITRERLYEKNPLREVILDSQVVPFFSLNFGNYVTLIKIMMMVKEKKKILCWSQLPPPSPMAFSAQLSLLSAEAKSLSPLCSELDPLAVRAWLSNWESPEGLSHPCLSALLLVISCPHPKINSSPNFCYLCLGPC